MRFNSKIVENLSKQQRPSDDIGIEIETELNQGITSDFVSKKMPNWSLKGDGSLRGHGYEFVTKGALRYNDIEKNVANWKTVLHENKYKCRPSERTSVHIHKNILNYTVLEAINSICSYWLVEPYLLDFCGESRRGNNFCLTLQDAGDIHTQLIKSIKSGKVFDNIEEAVYRYSSLNLYAIHRFGSLEVRLMRGTDSVDEITNWAKAIHQVIEGGKKYKTPREIINFLANKGPEEFLKTLMDKDLIKFFNSYSSRPNYSKIEENALLINDIAEARKSWDFFIDEKKVQNTFESLVEDKIKYLLQLGFADDRLNTNTISDIAKNIIISEAKKNGIDIFNSNEPISVPERRETPLLREEPEVIEFFEDEEDVLEDLRINGTDDEDFDDDVL